jgi:hypothetical protein
VVVVSAFIFGLGVGVAAMTVLVLFFALLWFALRYRVVDAEK